MTADDTSDVAPDKPFSHETVETVDLTPNPVTENALSCDNTRGAVLVPPANQTVETVDFDHVSAGRDESKSTVAALELLKSVGSDDDPYRPDGPWAYAEQAGGRVFMITTDWVHPDTGEVIMTRERLEGAQARKGNLRTAWVDHDKDVYKPEDVATNPRAVVGEPVPAHAHAMEERKNKTSIAAVARAYKVPPNFVKRMKGRGAFLDGCEYLTHEAPKEAHKYRYPDNEIHANFDFRTEVDEHVAARKSGGSRGTGSNMKERVRALRRAVATGEMTLDEAREEDLDAWAEDLPRLEKLRAAYDERAGRETAELIGPVWRKSLAVITGATRNGKDVLATELCSQLQRLAGLAGLSWSVAKPAGKNTLEGVGRAELVHHEDMRYDLLPSYDEALRYFDPNQATEAGARFKNRQAPTPRVVVATSSEMLLALGYTLKRRKPTDALVVAAADPTAKRFPLDIDEVLYRIGWYVEVCKPADAGSDLERIRAGMTVSIYRVKEGPAHRIETVRDRQGNEVGKIRTAHELEPVAVIRGVELAARFLAVSMIEERSPDVVAAIPPEHMEQLTEGRETVARLVADFDAAVLELEGRIASGDLPAPSFEERFQPGRAAEWAARNGLADQWDVVAEVMFRALPEHRPTGQELEAWSAPRLSRFLVA